MVREALDAGRDPARAPGRHPRNRISEILSDYPAERVVPAIRNACCGSRPGRAGRLGCPPSRGPFPHAAVALVVLSLLCQAPDTRLKGIAPAPARCSARRPRARRSSPRAPLRGAAIVLQLSYAAGEAKYGVIFSVDGRGTLTWHVPAGYAGGARAAPPLDPQGPVVLPSAYELDDAPVSSASSLSTPPPFRRLGRGSGRARARASGPAGRPRRALPSPRAGTVLIAVEETGMTVMKRKRERGLRPPRCGAVAWTAAAEAPVPLRRFAFVTGSNDGGDAW